MTTLGIYLWTRLDIILFIFVLLTIISLIGLGVVLAHSQMIEMTQDEGTKDRWIRNLLITFIISLTVAVVIPSKKDAAMIYIIPKMAQSETFKEISNNAPEITKLAIDALKETLQGMNKTTTEE